MTKKKEKEMKKEEGEGKRRKTYALEDLLAADVEEAGVEVADALGDVDELGLVGGLDLAGADGEVEGEADAAVGLEDAEPVGAAAAAAGREADLVLARVRRREGEPARRLAPLRDYPVLVVEHLLL